jgi:exopolysaccharide production protein ExoQ
MPKIFKYTYSLPWLAMLFLVSTQQDNSAGVVGGYSFHKISIIFLLLLSLFLIIVKIKEFVVLLRGRWTYVILLIYITLSIAWAEDTVSAIRISLYFWGCAAISLAAAMALRCDHKQFFYLLQVYASMLVIGSLFVVLFKPGIGISESGRWNGITNHPNILGVASIISIWSNYSIYILSKSSKVKIFTIVLMLLSFLCIYGANSMTSLLVSLGVISLIFILKRYSAEKVIRIYIYVAVAAFFVILIFSFLYLIVPNYISIDVLFEMVGRDATFTGRTTLWDYGMRIISNNPVLGVGFQEYVNVGSGEIIKHFHNGYIELLIRGGMIAIIIVLIAVFQALLGYRRVNDKIAYVCFSAMIVAILIHNITEGSFGRGINPMWLIFSFIYFYKGCRTLKDDKI